MVLGLAACGDSDDGGAEGGGDAGGAELTSAEQEFADAWSTALQDDEDGFGVGADDADCMGAAIMAELGTGPFDDADITPEDLGEDDSGVNSPGEVLGKGTISVEQADAILDVWDEECADLAEVLSASGAGDFELDPEGLACFEDGLREGDLARNLLRPAFTSDDDSPDEESLGMIVTLLESCGDGEGSPIVDSIANELSADGTMSEEDARCIAQAVVDEIGIERLTELTAGGSFDDADPAAQQEITGALLTAAGACDVPIDAFGD